MGKFQDLTGQKFGRLKILKLAYKKIRNDKKSSRCYWLCQCDCGNTSIVLTDLLKSGHTQSCGCIAKEKRLKALTKHNLSNTRLYNIWCGIKSRCYNKNFIEYKNYGGRGITICNEWKNDFQNFYDWSMTNGYTDDLSIDRIDVNGNYEASNCRWVTQKQQCRNMRKSHYLTYNNETLTVAEWAEKLNIKYSTLIARCYKNWTEEEILTKALKGNKNICKK